MKSLRISEDIHQKLTSLLGQLMAQTGKMQTYQDVIRALTNESLMLPPELLGQIQNFIEENRQLGFTTMEEFVRDAIRFRLTWLNGENRCVEVPKEQYEKLTEAVKKMNPPYQSVEDFLSSQIRNTIGKYDQQEKAKRK
jgi:Arc/MetJ-type ribon-helix-helix transcriptional regulator